MFYAFNRIILANGLQGADVEVRYCLQLLKTCHLFLIVSMSLSFSILRTIIETGQNGDIYKVLVTNSKNIKMTNSCFQVSLQHLSYISIMYIVVATYKISILETFSYKLETKRHFFGRDSPFCYMIVKQQDLDKITSQKNFTFRS